MLRAQTGVARGEEVTVRYLPALMGSARRRMRIRKNWGFDCDCARCGDPTELGTHVGATRCAQCSCATGAGAVERTEKAALVEYMRKSLANKFGAKEEEEEGTCAGNLVEKIAGSRARQDNLGEGAREGPGGLGVMLPKDPLDYFGDYECDRCGRTVGGLTIYALNKGLEDETNSFEAEDVAEIEERLGTLLRVLYSNHYLVLRTKKMLLDVLLVTKEPE